MERDLVARRQCLTLRANFWAGAAIDAGAAGVVSYCRSFGYPPSDSELPQGSGYSGAGVTLNRGDDSPGTDSGRQATSCETTTVSTLGWPINLHCCKVIGLRNERRFRVDA